jgi:hypothetical protein
MIGPWVNFTILLTVRVYKRGLLSSLLILYLSEIPHFREFCRYAHVNPTPVGGFVGDIISWRIFISEAAITSTTVTFVNTDLTSQSPVCFTDVRVKFGYLCVTVFHVILPAKPPLLLTHFCAHFTANFKSSCIPWVESSLDAKVEFEPQNPLPFQIAKPVEEKGKKCLN